MTAKYPAAFINALSDGPKSDVVAWLQTTWDELQDARALQLQVSIELWKVAGRMDLCAHVDADVTQKAMREFAEEVREYVRLLQAPTVAGEVRS